LPGTAQRYRLGVAFSFSFYVPLPRYSSEITELLSSQFAGHRSPISVIAKVRIVADIAVTADTAVKRVAGAQGFPMMACAVPNIVFLGIRAVSAFNSVGVTLAHTAIVSLVVLPIFPQAIVFGCLSVRCRCIKHREHHAFQL